MKTLKRVTVFVFCLLAVVITGLYLTGNSHLIKAVGSTYLVGKTGPTIDDYPKFINRTVPVSEKQPWKQSSDFNQYLLSEQEEAIFTKWETSSVVVIKGGELLFEKFWTGYSTESLTNSFSMAKSLTSLCIGAAIKEGKIKSTEEPISNYFTEFKGSDITIKDLLTMSSGIDFGESYGDPFGFMAKAYYGTNVYDLTLSKKQNKPAGTEWKYQGGNTLLLSFIIEKATGKTLSNYFAEKFWQPLGAEHDAIWTIDKENGKERSYCCFYSNALDYAKVGQLMLDSGRWNGKSLIDFNYFETSVTPVGINDEAGVEINHYGYQWWLGTHNGVGFYYARGILGQYIVSVPEWNVVFVRLGHKRDPTRNTIVPSDLFEYLDIVEQIKEPSF